ncbi:MAG TPA: hypothetical protein VHX36_17295 [Candidatus Acidoferrales bacterium]|nr:hypothetical protein [Candidatus Acidoferrales bacterium]
MRLAKWSLAILLAAPLAIPFAACAQSQDSAQSSQQDSLAAAARRAREEKKDQPKPAKVWDNDNIPSDPGAVSVVGDSAQGAAAPSDQAASDQQPPDQQPSADSTTQAPPAGDKDKAAKAAALDADKKQLGSLKTDLDILQRKFALDQQMYYGKPDYSSDKAGAAALKGEQDQIDAKKQQIDDLQKEMNGMQSQVGAPAATSPAPNPPANDQNQK